MSIKVVCLPSEVNIDQLGPLCWCPWKLTAVVDCLCLNGHVLLLFVFMLLPVFMLWALYTVYYP